MLNIPFSGELQRCFFPLSLLINEATLLHWWKNKQWNVGPLIHWDEIVAAAKFFAVYVGQKKRQKIGMSVSHAVLLKLRTGLELPRGRSFLTPLYAGQWDKVACIIYAPPGSERANTPEQIRWIRHEALLQKQTWCWNRGSRHQSRKWKKNEKKNHVSNLSWRAKERDRMR